MNREELNRLRRMAGVAQDFSAPTREELTETEHGDYSGTGATTGNPDNHVHPDEKEMADAINGREEVEDENDFETDDKFEKGDHVRCHDEDCVVVVADADADFVVVAPLGSETDIDAFKMVQAGELQRMEDDSEDDMGDEEMSDEVESDVDDVGDEEMSDEVEMDESMKISMADAKKEQTARAKKAGMEPKTNICPACEGKCKVDGKTCPECKGKGKVFESMHYHTDDNYETFADDEKSPVNVTAPYPSVWDDPDFEEEAEDYEMANDTEKVHVPAKVLTDLKKVITDCEKEAEKAEKRDNFERKHYYADTAEALQIVHDHLSLKTVEGLKRAQLFSHRMMNVSRALMPDHVWKFIIDGGVKRSLKDYMNDVKDTGYPKVGPRNTLDDNN